MAAKKQGRKCYGCENTLHLSFYKQLTWEIQAKFCCIKTMLFILFNGGFPTESCKTMHDVKVLLENNHPPILPIKFEWKCRCENELEFNRFMKFEWNSLPKWCCEEKTLDLIQKFDEAVLPSESNIHLKLTLMNLKEDFTRIITRSRYSHDPKRDEFRRNELTKPERISRDKEDPTRR
jgi:hypothetical protein